jgi:hypothetical protein
VPGVTISGCFDGLHGSSPLPARNHSYPLEVVEGSVIAAPIIGDKNMKKVAFILLVVCL